MIRLRWREVQRVQWRWIGPFDMASPLRVAGAGPVSAVIGPKGERGLQGIQGTPGDGATDPGDLTLIFNNQLI